jgi:hypothetical protein
MTCERQQQAGATGVEDGVVGSPGDELAREEEPATWRRNRAGWLLRLSGGRGEPWAGRGEDAEEEPDLAAAAAELDGGRRSRRRRPGEIRHGHGRETVSGVGESVRGN